MEKRLRLDITEIAALLRQGECSVREGMEGIEEAFEDWQKRKKIAARQQKLRNLTSVKEKNETTDRS